MEVDRMTAEPEARTLEPSTRALTEAERKLLATRERQLRSDSRSGRVFHVAVVATAILWLLTLLVSDAPWPVVTLFWIVVGGGVGLWAWWDAERDSRYGRAMADDLRSALEEDRAKVYDIRARAYVEFEEYEDEGACYAFDLGGGRVVFVVGQSFYPTANFPSLDFSLVHALSPTGRAVDEWIEKRGKRTAPERVVARELKWNLKIPNHLTLLEGTLDGLEGILGQGG